MGKDAIDHIRVTDLILAYQIRGHELANLDPLQLREPRDVPELSLEYHGLSASRGRRGADIPLPSVLLMCC